MAAVRRALAPLKMGGGKRIHPSALWCYAWEVDGTVTAVLHKAPVDSARAAVRASIVSTD